MVFLSIVVLMLTTQQTFFDFSANTIDGKPQQLDTYRGKVVLVVNVASFCGYTPQYEQLQALYTKYADSGLVVVAFPSNDFGAQEPGTSAEIREFCSMNYGVTFPLFEKIVVKGADMHPLYKWLVAGGGKQEFAAEIPWNFEKFLISKEGHVIGRFNYKVRPDDPQVLSAIEQALN